MLDQTFLLVAGPLTVGSLLVATTSCLLHFRLRNRFSTIERLSAARGRYLLLAAEELRGSGIALMAQASRAPPAARVEPEHLEATAQQLLSLADDLAAFAAEPSSRSLREAPMLLGPVVEAAIASVVAQIRPGLRHWKVDPNLRMLTVNADGRALKGALVALLRRAARHSRDGNVISLRHVVDQQTLAIIVEDEGDGLPALDLAAQAAGGTLRPSTGSPNGTRGLDVGLALARSLAAAHGGDIRLETSPGIGSRAWLTLPRCRLVGTA